MSFFKKTIDPNSLIEEVKRALLTRLDGNLVSLVLYGSAVRGKFNPETSDLNLLMLIKDLNTSSQIVISEILMKYPRVNPMIVESSEFQRSAQLFRLKFQSIHRHCRVLHGENPFVGFEDSLPDAFAIEQSLVNSKLKLTRMFVLLSSQKKPLTQLLRNMIPGVITQASYPLRIEKKPVANDFTSRISQLESFYSISLPKLTQMLTIEEKSSQFDLVTCMSVQDELRSLINRSIEKIRS